MNEKLLAHFNEQAGYCALFGSPFTALLIERMRDDVIGGGPTKALVGEWPGNPRADAVALRLAGAAHAAALTERDAALAALYPPHNAWHMDQVWPAVCTLFEREQGWVRDFIRSAPQTNETRRSIALLAGFLTFAETWNGPVDMFEIGASAGLNVNWDRFSYRTRDWSWGPDSPVIIDTDWNGPAPPTHARIAVRHRAACDLNPLDITDDGQRLQLRSYVWPDQPERLARFDGAVELARANNVQVERADAANWLAQKLNMRESGAATIVYHSIFLQYPPTEARAAIVAAIEEAGAAATPEAPLAWVRLEPEALLDGVQGSPRMMIDLITYPGARRRILGHTDGHVRAVYAA